jgi:phosphohistidine phosphatase
MKELVFMRHGLALSPRESGIRGDAGRELAPEGKIQIAAASNRLRELGVLPGLIISSPFRRAVETADIAAGLFPAARRLKEPALVSAGPITDILRAISSAADGEACVLVVGHQPILSSLIGHLLGTAGLPLSTGSFAYLKLSGGLNSGAAVLAELFSPEPF